MEQSSGGRSHQLTVLGADNTEENRVVRGRGCSGTSQMSPSTVILEPLKIKSLTVSTVSPSICHEVIGKRVSGT